LVSEAGRIRSAEPADLPEVLALNRASEQFLSPLDEDGLVRLHTLAAYHRVVEVDGKVGAFLLALRDGTDYESSNYRWFAERHRTFLYIDRVVVAAQLRGQRLGALLYEDLFGFARQSRVALVTCEYDIEPPNIASARFHASFGFHRVGQRVFGDKRVAMQALTLMPVAALGK
jgi:predicted GNAT superfamily acetyltransferase